MVAPMTSGFLPWPPAPAASMRAPASGAASQIRRMTLDALDRVEHGAAGLLELVALIGRRLAVEEVLGVAVEEDDEPALAVRRRGHAADVLEAGEAAVFDLAPRDLAADRQAVDHV